MRWNMGDKMETPRWKARASSQVPLGFDVKFDFVQVADYNMHQNDACDFHTNCTNKGEHSGPFCFYAIMGHHLGCPSKKGASYVLLVYGLHTKFQGYQSLLTMVIQHPNAQAALTRQMPTLAALNDS